MLVERALALTVWEELLWMFYFFLSLGETSSYQTCHFWITLMLVVEACEIWLACLSFCILLFVDKTFIFNEAFFIDWIKSITSGEFEEISVVAIWCLLPVFPCYSEDFAKKTYCLRRSFLEKIKMLLVAVYRVFCHKPRLSSYMPVNHSLVVLQLLLSSSY